LAFSEKRLIRARIMIAGALALAVWESGGCVVMGQSTGTTAIPGGTSSKPASGPVSADSKTPSYQEGQQQLSATPKVVANPNAETNSLRAWAGLKIEAIQFSGVSGPMLEPLPSQLEVQAGQPMDAQKIRQSLRRLYATGLYRAIDVEGIRHGDLVTIIFKGTPTTFIGRITVNGVKDDRLSSVLQRSTKLNPGTVFSDNKLTVADDALKSMLQNYGYYESKISRKVVPDQADFQSDVQYQIDPGKVARIGDVKVDGDSGFTPPAFRKRAKLKEKSKVTRDTVNRALTRLRKNYQKQNRLEATLGLASKDYQPTVHRLDYHFDANQGPIVDVEVQGAKLSKGQIHRLIPVYEEGAVDDDLLNEGDRRLRDYFQRKGYFDAKITHTRSTQDPKHSVVIYTAKLGVSHRVDSVSITGNKYFDKDTLSARLSVHAANILEKHGVFSQTLVTADVNAIKTLYQGNGFKDVDITADVKDTDDQHGEPKNLAHLKVKYAISEGKQQRIGKLEITGTKQVPLSTLTPMLNTQEGQPYSAANLSGDRDAILGYYLSHGFDHVDLQVYQTTRKDDPTLVDISMKLTEGDQIFVNRVLVSGLHYTRPQTVEESIRVHSGDALDQSALLETQRKAYDLTLFNEVNTAVQNPAGDELRKNVLVQFTEARRWDVNYGFGFEAQTGNPNTGTCNPATLIQLGLNPTTFHCVTGNYGVSPRVLFDVSRINLRGRDQSITMRTSYGTLQKRATGIFNSPHLFGDHHFDLSVSGGYTNEQDVTTYAASRLEGSVRLVEHPGDLTAPRQANTLIYEFTYRRVKVDPNSIQVAPNEIPLLSQPVRVGGPGFTWNRDTRDNPLDAHRGTYTSFQEFIAWSGFGSQANFNRVDLTNSSYYDFGKSKWVLARTTRFGFERSFGDAQFESIPLPERLYAGGATSHRGFSINAAGPRDAQTGFPIGGAGAFVNSTELRMPNPTLPYVGNSVGFVLFHDMGNVFTNSSDIWGSFIRTSQPHRDTCKDLTPPSSSSGSTSSTGQSGNCSFNYFSHALGLGVRYHTPIGPLRGDFSYNLNPPIFPVIIDYTGAAAHVGQAAHFNFFFSIGQSF
jgi:outer membrane protein insertion porin family